MVALISGAACTDLDSATNLNPEGPPMVRQVRMREMFQDAAGNINERLSPVFAFGTHPQVTTEEEAHPVTSAKAVGNKLRVIVDELLVGNYIEQIACRAPIDDDSYDNVPVGATPDDIARCSVARDALPRSCSSTSKYSVCLCQLDGGCGEGIAKGDPVGVLDVNQDGAADDTRMIPGAAGIKCGSIDVAMDLNQSYWNPSGDQNVPAMGGFDALGPAIVLVPAQPPGTPMGTPQVLPTNLTCGLVFSPSVVDKQNNTLCAPPEGDITKGCAAGDMSAFSFKTEALAVKQSNVADGEMGVSRTGSIDITLTAPPDPASLAAGVVVTQGGMQFTGFTVAMALPDTLRITWTGTLAANEMYTITITTGIYDFYKQAAPMPVSYTFTTGA